jgi:hypothetical protein
MAAKRAMRTVNAMPNFGPMRLVFNANSCECPLRLGQGLERRIFPGQPRETMQSLRIGVFEMRGIARTYSKPRTIPIPKNTTATTPIQTRLLLNAALNFRLTFCGEIDDGLGTAQGVLSQFDPTPSGKVTIVTKGGQRINAASRAFDIALSEFRRTATVEAKLAQRRERCF